MSSDDLPSPFVFWAQNASHVFLKVDLKSSADHDIAIIEEEVEFEANGIGGQGKATRYHFLIEFFLPVDPDESTYEVREREVRIVIKKKDADWWPRLLYAQQKLPWLKIDFDRWKEETDESDLDDESPEGRMKMDELTSEDFLRTKYPDAYNRLQREELGYISESKKRIYLFCYNLFMFCGFLFVLCIMSLKYSKMGEDFFPETYTTVGKIVNMLHLLMFLEVLHPIFGYTKGSPLIPFAQIFGRNLVLFLLIDAEPRMHEKPVVFYLFAIYTLAEVIRYPYYMLRVYDIEVDLLTWLRYTIWIPLYPAGFFCEGVIALRDIPYFEETQRFTVTLPNSWNFAFDFSVALRMYLLFGFFPVLYSMVTHMYNLRCKKLGIKQYSRKNKRQ